MLNRHSSQNVKSAVRPHTMTNDEAVRAAFIDMQLVAGAWPAVLNLHSAMLLVAEVDQARTASHFTHSHAAFAELADGTQPSSFHNDVVQPSRTTASDACGFRWLTSLKEAVLSLHAHWQREREIRKAVAALSQFDDRTLRDMGIVSRTEIEHAVRCWRDG
ncbi:DUF1127 domain-containing protein [Bradyrhizobium cenepequi]